MDPEKLQLKELSERVFLSLCSRSDLAIQPDQKIEVVARDLSDVAIFLAKIFNQRWSIYAESD